MDLFQFHSGLQQMSSDAMAKGMCSNLLSELDKEWILCALDGLLRDAKTRQAYK
ncbi:hypothetical protein D3C87_1734660 [compost metagenome]